LSDSEVWVYDDEFHSEKYISRKHLTEHHVVVERDGSDYVNEEQEAHHYSYLTLGEILRCLAHAELPLSALDLYFHAALDVMKRLELQYYTRLVFWFND